MFLLVVFRIALFVFFFLALLKVKKRRFRHLPARRTRISRRHGETTLWVERLVNALIDMWFTSLVTQGEATTQGKSARTNTTQDAEQGGAPDGEDMTDDDVPESMAAAATALLRPALSRLEERVNASLEDSGVAAWADFHIHSVGARPPRLRAIHIIQQHAVVRAPSGAASTPPATAPTPPTGTTHAKPVSAANQASPTTPTAADVRGTTTGIGGATFGNLNPSTNGSGLTNPLGGFTDTTSGGGPERGATPSPSLSASLRLRRGGGGAGEDTVHEDDLSPSPGAPAPPSSENGRGDAPAASDSHMGSSPPSAGVTPTVLEFEAEIEYSGRFDASLKADVSFGRGRLVPVYVRLQDVRLIRAHVRVSLQLCFEPATMDTARKPFLEGTVWLESDPQFDMTMRTSLTRLNIQDFFLVPTLVRFFVLRAVRSKLVRRNKAPGLTFRVPVPANLVDGGESVVGAESLMTDYLNGVTAAWHAP